MTMRYFDREMEAMYERRGNKWYGMCDYGCKAIVREKWWPFYHAMIAHNNEHHGQLVLPTIDLPDIPPF